MRLYEPRDFSKRGDTLPIPNLIDVQIESYKRFLQKEVDPKHSERTKDWKPCSAKSSPSKATMGTFAWNTSATTSPSRATPPMNAAPCG